MKCPKCAGSTTRIEVTKNPEYGLDFIKDAERTRKLEIDQCLSCNGIWFDERELDAYLAEKLLIVDSPKPAGYKSLEKKEASCPNCKVPMEKRQAPKSAGFKIDVCPQCRGIWLDGSELDRLENKNMTLKERSGVVMRNLVELFRK